MYDNANKYCQLAHVPITLSKKHDLHTPIFDTASPTYNDSFTGCSSLSSSSFDDPDELINDSLLTQILCEYSNETFPTFVDIESYDDFDTFVGTPLSHVETFCNDFESVNVEYAYDYGLFEGEVDSEAIYSDVLSSSDSSNSLITNERKRISYNFYSEWEPRAKSTKNECSTFMFDDENKKVGNRDAAFRYRQKQKNKKSKDEEELDIATSDMLRAKGEMLELRQSIITMKNLAEELLSQRDYSLKSGVYIANEISY